ncbi:uncharacterized protein LOC143192539 isoform X2 [Rhynchophorus ferrugineus]
MIRFLLFGVTLVTAVGFALYEHYSNRAQRIDYFEKYNNYGHVDLCRRRRRGRSNNRNNICNGKNCSSEDVDQQCITVSCGHTFHSLRQ